MTAEHLKLIRQLKEEAVTAKAFGVAAKLRDAQIELSVYLQRRKKELIRELEGLESIKVEP